HDALASAMQAMDADKQSLRAAIAPDAPRAETAATLEEPTLLDVLERASGLHGKQRVVVEIISPDLDVDDHRPADEKLAGEFLFHFGGFFDVLFRQSDFALGYRNASAWLEGWLPGHVQDPSAVLARVGSEYDRLGWDAIRRGGASLRSLSLREDLQAAELV